MTALRLGHAPIVVPRLHRFGEHVDDHQLDIARRLQERGLVRCVEPGDTISLITTRVDRSGGEIGPNEGLLAAVYQAAHAQRRKWLRRVSATCIELAATRPQGCTPLVLPLGRPRPDVRRFTISAPTRGRSAVSKALFAFWRSIGLARTGLSCTPRKAAPATRGVSWMTARAVVALVRLNPERAIAHVHRTGRFSLRRPSALGGASCRGVPTVATNHGSRFVEFAHRRPRLVAGVLRQARAIRVRPRKHFRRRGDEHPECGASWCPTRVPPAPLVPRRPTKRRRLSCSPARSVGARVRTFLQRHGPSSLDLATRDAW